MTKLSNRFSATINTSVGNRDYEFLCNTKIHCQGDCILKYHNLRFEVQTSIENI